MAFDTSSRDGVMGYDGAPRHAPEERLYLKDQVSLGSMKKKICTLVGKIIWEVFSLVMREFGGKPFTGLYNHACEHHSAPLRYNEQLDHGR